jgi:segregation and condensation protein B
LAELKHKVEAALFSAGKPLSIGEIAKAMEMDEATVRDGMRQLLKVYRVRETALEIVKTGPHYSLQLKSEYIPPTQVVARKELPLPVLKIAALVGYYQPMHKKDLVEMVGNRGWEHVLTLEKMNLLQVKRSGHGYRIETTPKYAEYFGLAAKSREDIKRILAKKVGITLTEKPKAAQAEQPASSAGSESTAEPQNVHEGADAATTASAQPEEKSDPASVQEK